jgi:hypothetical protein
MYSSPNITPQATTSTQSRAGRRSLVAIVATRLGRISIFPAGPTFPAAVMHGCSGEQYGGNSKNQQDQIAFHETS